MTTCTTCGQTLPSTTPAPGREWTVVIPKKLKSANAYVVNHGAARWAYAKERKEWVEWLALNRVNHQITEATGKRLVSIDRLFSGRERLIDPDNLAASTKSLLDAMVLVGLLKDDSAQWLDVDWSQERSEASGVRIRIQEAGP